MPPVSCPHCGEDTLTITGWTRRNRCAGCGRPLASGPIEPGAALAVRRGRRPTRRFRWPIEERIAAGHRRPRLSH